MTDAPQRVIPRAIMHDGCQGLLKRIDPAAAQ
jgi:hypothetical protein